MFGLAGGSDGGSDGGIQDDLEHLGPRPTHSTLDTRVRT